MVEREGGLSKQEWGCLVSELVSCLIVEGLVDLGVVSHEGGSSRHIVPSRVCDGLILAQVVFHLRNLQLDLSGISESTVAFKLPSALFCSNTEAQPIT